MLFDSPLPFILYCYGSVLSLSAIDEYEARDRSTNIPANPNPDDTDRDGIEDSVEISRGSDPNVHGIFPGSFPHIPEPMVFDLVRGLGARRGEFEGNTLVVTRFTPYGGISWAPEIEWAFADRFALEFEVPLHDAKVEALKLAVQGTMRESRRAFIHGWQTILEWIIDDESVEVTGLYLAGIRIKKRPSLFLMIGPRVALNAQDKPQVEMIANPSVFVDITETFTLGLETNGVVAGGDSSVALIPQIHAQLGRHIRIQCGGGVEYSLRSWRPLLGLRVVIE